MTAGAQGPTVLAIGGARPRVAADCFIAPGAVLVGDVQVAAGASIWFNCVLRGDVAPIIIGEGTNVQDGTVVHADPGFPTVIGANVLIGHMALVHGCTIEPGGFVGMGSIVLSSAVIGAEGMLGAGAMLTGGKRIGQRELWVGRPAARLRDLREEEVVEMRAGVDHYRTNAERFRGTLRHPRSAG